MCCATRPSALHLRRQPPPLRTGSVSSRHTSRRARRAKASAMHRCASEAWDPLLRVLAFSTARLPRCPRRPCAAGARHRTRARCHGFPDARPGYAHPHQWSAKHRVHRPVEEPAIAEVSVSRAPPAAGGPLSTRHAIEASFQARRDACLAIRSPNLWGEGAASRR